MKQNNLKQEIVTLTGTEWIPDVSVGGAQTYSNTLCLNPNNFRFYNGGGTVTGIIPQTAIFD